MTLAAGDTVTCRHGLCLFKYAEAQPTACDSEPSPAVFKPYFEDSELRQKEEAAGGSGWDARKKKSEFLQRVSITIAKGTSNSRVLDCVRRDWQSSTAPDLVTS